MFEPVSDLWLTLAGL